MLATLPEEDEQQQQRQQQQQHHHHQVEHQLQQQGGCHGGSGSGSWSSSSSSSIHSFCGDVHPQSATSSRSTSCEVPASSSGVAASRICSRRLAVSAKVVPERSGAAAKLEQRYRVSAREAGKGGFGVVFVAEDREVPGRRVAVKKILATTLAKRQSFDLEVSLLKQLDHPSISNILETYVNGQVLSIVMEQCWGGDVFERVARSGPLKEEIAADVIRQVSSALKYAHGLGIAHRDIKPENVCFCSPNPEDTSVKVIDWGTGFRFRGAAMRSAAGSFMYAAPEIRNTFAGYTEACDLWSLGVMTYVVLSGKVPFWGTYENQIRNMDAEQYPLSDTEWQTVSDCAKDLVQKLIRAKPEQRLSAEETLRHPWLQASMGQETREAITRQLYCNLRRFAGSSHSVATYATVVAKHMDHRSCHEVRKVFESLDTNNDGALSFDELKVGFEGAFGARSKEVQYLEVVFANLDLDDSGEVNYTEFLAAALGEGACAKDDALLAAFHDFEVGNAIRQELSHISVSSVVGEKAQPEDGFTIQQWLHSVREPHRRRSRQPFPFEVESSASAASRCSTTFFGRACEVFSGRGLGSRVPSLRPL